MRGGVWKEFLAKYADLSARIFSCCGEGVLKVWATGIFELWRPLFGFGRELPAEFLRPVWFENMMVLWAVYCPLLVEGVVDGEILEL